jgi:methane/ammonia monooxygenase subunit B
MTTMLVAIRTRGAGILHLVLLLALLPTSVLALGEKATEPYIRTRTVLWYDVNWSTDKIVVNDSVTVTGRFHLYTDWPDAASKPDVTFLGQTAPGASMVRVESYVNDVPAMQSFRGMELGRDYAFKIVMRGRVPGRWHLQPELSVKGAGAIIGPGKWIEVGGSSADFKAPVTTMTGVHVDDLQTYNIGRVQAWQLFWVVLGLAWLIWWLRRPLAIPRWLAVQKQRDDILVTAADDKLAAILIGVALVATIGGYWHIVKAFPYTIPLSGGSNRVEALPEEPHPVKVTHARAEYDVPGRTLRLFATVTNSGDRPVRIGEFTTAQLRFFNRQLADQMRSVPADYPKDLIATTGLKIDQDSAIQPGESRQVYMEATDAAWETERLMSFLNDIDSRIGGLMFFWDDSGKRYLAEIGGPVLPVFTQAAGLKGSTNAPAAQT